MGATDRLRTRGAPVVALVGCAWRAGRWLTAALAVVLGVVVVLPAAIAVASGALVAAAERAGQGMDASGRLAGAVGTLVVLFLLAQLVNPVVQALADALGRRLDTVVRARVMAASLAPASVAHLSDARALRTLSDAQSWTTGRAGPRDAVVAVASLTTQNLQGLVSGLVLVAFQWWLAAGLLAAYGLLKTLLVRDFRTSLRTVAGEPDALRRSAYLRELALTSAAAKDIRVFGLAGWLGGQFGTAWTTAMNQLRADRRGRGWLGVAVPAVVIVAQGGAFLLLGLAAVEGRIGVGELTTYATAILGMATLLGVSYDSARLADGCRAVVAMVDLERELRTARFSPPGDRTPPVLTEHLRLDGVSFRYPGQERWILRDLDLTIPAGRSVAVVGANGAGKSTLVNLLCRCHEPEAGRILVDGVDLAATDAGAWQRSVAAIFQSFTRFELSARANVGMTTSVPDPTVLADVADRANLDAVLAALPAGWDTVLSPRYPGGADLSGGQWQRVALARALYAVRRGARLLVLDEPTAALDPRAEAEFYDRFFDLTTGVTTLVVSHRFATVRRADTIVVLDGGRVVEHGGHEELMAANGRYARMFTVQADAFADEREIA